MWSTEAQVSSGPAERVNVRPALRPQTVRGVYDRWELWNHKPDLPAMGILGMNTRQLTDRADQIAENGILKLIGRTGMAFLPIAFITVATWLGNSIVEIKSEQAKFSGQVALLAQQITQLSEGKYTANDAARDAKAQTVKDSEQDRRLNALESKFERLQPLTTIVPPR